MGLISIIGLLSCVAVWILYAKLPPPLEGLAGEVQAAMRGVLGLRNLEIVVNEREQIIMVAYQSSNVDMDTIASRFKAIVCAYQQTGITGQTLRIAVDDLDGYTRATATVPAATLAGLDCQTIQWNTSGEWTIR